MTAAVVNGDSWGWGIDQEKGYPVTGSGLAQMPSLASPTTPLLSSRRIVCPPASGMPPPCLPPHTHTHTPRTHLWHLYWPSLAGKLVLAQHRLPLCQLHWNLRRQNCAGLTHRTCAYFGLCSKASFAPADLLDYSSLNVRQSDGLYSVYKKTCLNKSIRVQYIPRCNPKHLGVT